MANRTPHRTRSAWPCNELPPPARRSAGLARGLRAPSPADVDATECPVPAGWYRCRQSIPKNTVYLEALDFPRRGDPGRGPASAKRKSKGWVRQKCQEQIAYLSNIELSAFDFLGSDNSGAEHLGRIRRCSHH